MNTIEIPPSSDCTVYPTYGPKTISTDYICGLDFELNAECISISQTNTGSGGNSGGASGMSGAAPLTDYIIITINITEKNIDTIPPYIIVQIELVDPKGSVIKPFDNDAIMTGDSISFNVPRPPCPNNPNIFLEVGNISARLVLPCDGEISGSCSGSDSGSDSGSEPGCSEESGSGPLGYAILFDKESWSSTVPQPTQTYLNTAADVWKSIALLNPEVVDSMRSTNPAWNGITLDDYIEYNDSGSNVVAYCILTSAVSIDGVAFNATSFTLGINFAYGMSAAAWTTVLIHELGHALGIGFWNMDPQYWLDGAVYPDTLDGYKSHINSPLDRLYIPVEDTGNSGSVGVHWEDSARVSGVYETPDGFSYPPIDDIMNATLDINSPYFISSVSRGYLKDLKYSVSSSVGASLVLPPVSMTISGSNLSIAQKWCGCGDHCNKHPIKITNLYQN